MKDGVSNNFRSAQHPSREDGQVAVKSDQRRESGRRRLIKKPHNDQGPGFRWPYD